MGRPRPRAKSWALNLKSCWLFEVLPSGLRECRFSPYDAGGARCSIFFDTYIHNTHAHILYELPPRWSKETGSIIPHWLQIILWGYTAPYSCSTCHHAEGKEGVGFPLVGGLIIFFYYKPIRCIYEAGGCGFTLDMIMEIGRVMMVPR